MTRWAERTALMLADPNARNTWRRQYGGVAQAALVTLLNQKDHGLALLPLPCAEWNCEDSAWAIFRPTNTRILHIKSELRHSVFGTKVTRRTDIKKLAAQWRAIEQESLRAQQVSA
jgi:hypothetical protein